MLVLLGDGRDRARHVVAPLSPCEIRTEGNEDNNNPTLHVRSFLTDSNSVELGSPKHENTHCQKHDEC